MYKEQRLKRESHPVSVEKIVGKQLPASIEAERSVLSALLLSDEYVLQVTEIITAEDFYSIAHQNIFGTIAQMVQSHKRIDIISLQDELNKKNLLESIGGIVYLVSLQ